MERIKIKKDIQAFRWGKDRLDVAQNMDRWQSLTITVTDCTFCKICGISSLSERRLAFQEGICSIEIVSQLLNQLVS